MDRFQLFESLPLPSSLFCHLQGNATDHQGGRTGRPAARGRHGQAQLVGSRHPDGLAAGIYPLWVDLEKLMNGKIHPVPFIRKTVILRIDLFLNFDGNLTSTVAFLFLNYC